MCRLAVVHCIAGTLGSLPHQLYSRMGRSKRERPVALTKTRKILDNREKKLKHISQIRQHVDDYENIYLFQISNMRNTLLKKLRDTWSDSRFSLGRKSLAQVAFGKEKQTEHADGISELATQVTGNVGLLFTNRPHEEVAEFFSTYEEEDYARSGFVATETVKLDEGELDMFVHSQEPNLRLLGLPVTVKRGKVILLQDFTVCKEGDVLTPERAKLLEYLGYKLAKFALTLLCLYNKDSGVKKLEK